MPKWTLWTFIISHFALTYRMTNSQRLATVRARLVQWLADQRKPNGSADGSENPIVRESVLIRNEFYCGRRFYTADHHAIWFIEEDELKIYRSSGELECVLSSEEMSSHSATLEQPRNELAEQQSPEQQGAEEPVLPSVFKIPPPIETNAEADDDSDNEIRRAA